MQQLQIDRTVLDEFSSRNNLSAPEQTKLEGELQALIQRGELDLLRLQKKSFDEIETLVRARKNGHIPLRSLLGILASEEAIASAKAGKISDPQARGCAELERHEVYKCLLGHAKREILARRLIVRTLTYPHPEINEEPSIKAWCESNHALQGIEEAAPHGRVVVGIDEAQRWLQRMLGAVPAWLQNPPSILKEKKGRRDRQVDVIVSLAKDFGLDPLSIPDDDKSKIKAECLASHKDLFTDDGFDHAWNVASAERHVIRTQNADLHGNKKKKK